MAARKGTKTRKTAKTSSTRKAKGRKSSTKPKVGKSINQPAPWAVLFWLAFAILIFCLYIYNREAINNGIQIIVNAFSSREASETAGGRAPEVKDKEPPTATPAKQPSVVQPAEPVKPQESTPNPGQTVPEQNPPVQRPPETRERVLYFVQVDRTGYISRVQANRRLPVSDSPLADVIQALIAGPNADEKNAGLISLIPPSTKLLSASIRGNTAFLNFNEEFQYNTYGVEGYAGQLRQIVFTVTEFSNVADVQILIEGRRIDYLGEGVWVGSPVSRDML